MLLWALSSDWVSYSDLRSGISSSPLLWPLFMLKFLIGFRLTLVGDYVRSGVGEVWIAGVGEVWIAGDGAGFADYCGVGVGGWVGSG